MFAETLIGLGIAGSLVSCYFLPHLSRYYNVRKLFTAAATTRTLVLTYDDGPGPGSTPQLLSLLNKWNVRANFFLLGQRAEVSPDLVDRMIREGHEVGCHSYAHLHAWKVLPWKSLGDVTRGYKALSPWIPKGGYFRPPYGKTNLAITLSLWHRRVQTAWWTIDSGDTSTALPQISAIVDRVRKFGGGVVLMHDFDRRSERMKYVLSLTTELLEMAKHEQMRVCILSDLEIRSKQSCPQK